MKIIFRYFIQGLLLFAPLGLTIYIIYLVFRVVDDSVRDLVQTWFHVTIPGIGILTMFLLTTFLGFIGGTIIMRPVKKLIDMLMEKTPLLNLIYTSIRDLLSAFMGKEKKFNQPVLVKVNLISDLEKVGFITQTDLEDFGLKGKVSVYFPHSYNFSGEMFIVPVEQVRPLNIPPAAAMKFVVSGGVAKDITRPLGK
jgi:uncharacterized membrane protein